ncbi:hypothetical protein SUGI_0198790 [Cryptomeria japonica]|nr:hypothetical protein SUGI_0198790 [Cryptomeria japonica]
MAAPLRRALFSASSRRFIALSIHKPRAFHYWSMLGSYVNNDVEDQNYVVGSCVYGQSGLNQRWQRGFAKGKKSKGDEGMVEVVPDIGPSVKSAATAQMQAALDALSRELNKLRTGRASSGMLDHIIVESGGIRTPLSHIAAVSVLDPQTLSVTPYDVNSMKEIERAIVSSPLGLNPTSEGQRLVVPVPESSKEHIQAMLKLVTKAAEDVKQSIRRARQKAVDSIKKVGSGMSKDDVKRLEKEVDDVTKKFVKSAEDMCKEKEKEITGK